MPRPRPEPVPGVHPIDTGSAELAPDEISGGWLLQVNGTHSSHLHLDDPAALDFEYLRQMAAVISEHQPTTERLNALHLGAAACALPRHLDAAYPDARQVAVEIDAELARLVRDWFDLPRAPRLRIRVGDAREVVRSLQPGTRNVLVRDAFADDRTPRHLTTVEFVREAARVLAPGGLYLVNCGDSRSLVNARADAAAVAEVFGHLMLIADPAMFKGRRTGNVVIVGSDAPLEPSAGLVRTLLSDPMPAHVLAGAEAMAFGRGARHDEPAERDEREPGQIT